LSTSSRALAGGSSQLDNLALSCPSCNLQKSNRVEVPSPDGGEQMPLFHPRTDDWRDHFRYDGYYMTGLTPVGRATVEPFLPNDDRKIKIRQAEAWFDLFPPDV
jgi:hypothetical protein